MNVDQRDVGNMPGLYGRIPDTFNLIRYTPLRAVMYSVFPSTSPQAQFAGISGTSIVPRCFPRGEITSTPPGPVA
jgi:hypothetical protein